MKTITLLLAALLCGCSVETPVGAPSDSNTNATVPDLSAEIKGMKSLSDISFAVGLRWGYACREVGGSEEDAEMLIRYSASNRVDLMAEWLRIQRNYAITNEPQLRIVTNTIIGTEHQTRTLTYQ
jgi:hypothetical protein